MPSARSLIKQIAEDFYPIEHAADLEDILSRIKDGDKPELSKDVMMTPEELWPYREFTRSNGNGRYSEKDWDKFKSDMQENGWDQRNPLALMVSEDGKALVVDGNHRLALARECKIEQVPVRMIFVKDLDKASRA